MHPVIISALFTLFLLLIIYPLLENSFLDYPVKRSSHTIPTPKGGGIVFSIVGIIGSFFYNVKIIYLCIPLAIIGFLDDKYNLTRRVRFSAQFITAIFLLKESNLLLKVLNLIGKNYYIVFPFIIFAIVLIIAFINFTNFLDGLDGLLCGCMIVAISVEAYLVNSYLWILVGSLLAFLILNWHPAKLFMGDSGSTFLGALYIGFAINANSIEQFFGLILVVLPLMADAFSCVIRRFCYKQKIFTPHKLHLFQRLNQSGLSHSSVSVIYILGTSLISFALVFLNIYYASIAAILVLIYGVYLDKFVAVEFRVR